LKKKNQKNFSPLAGVDAGARSSPPGGSKRVKVFLLLFFQKKKALALLPLAFAFSGSEADGALTNPLISVALI
jgi:hypothetical protein